MGHQQRRGGESGESEACPSSPDRGRGRGEQREAHPRHLEGLGLRECVERLDRRPRQREEAGRHGGVAMRPAAQPDRAAEKHEKPGEQKDIDGEEGKRPRPEDPNDDRVHEPVGRKEPAGFGDEVEDLPPCADDAPDRCAMSGHRREARTAAMPTAEA